MFQNKPYRLAYDFHKKWAPCPAAPETWEKMGLEAAALCHLHGNAPFLMDLITAVMDDFGREYENAERPGTPGALAFPSGGEGRPDRAGRAVKDLF